MIFCSTYTNTYTNTYTLDDDNDDYNSANHYLQNYKILLYYHHLKGDNNHVELNTLYPYQPEALPTELLRVPYE